MLKSDRFGMEIRVCVRAWERLGVKIRPFRYGNIVPHLFYILKE